MSKTDSKTKGKESIVKATPKQLKIINGLMLGDGYIRSSDNSYFLRTCSIRECYIDWLQRELCELYSSRWEYEPKGRNYGNETQYYILSKSLPWLENFRERWYRGSNKIVPENLSLNRLTLKIWYIGDGTLSWTASGSPRISIAAQSKTDSKSKIKYLLHKEGFLSAKFSTTGNIYLSVSDSKKFLQRFSEPIPGYEYKFAESKEKYQKIKPKHLKT